MKRYSIPEGAIQRARRNYILSSIGIGLGLALILGLLVVATQGEAWGLTTGSIAALFAAFMGLFATGAWFGAQRGLRRLQAQMSSYEVSLGENAISARQGDQTLSIKRSQARRLLLRGGQGLTIEAADRSLSIPASIEGYAELLDILTGWAPVEVAPRGVQTIGLGFGWALLNLGGITAVFLLENPWIIVPLALLVSSSLALIGISIWRNPALPPRARAGTLLVAAAIIAVLLRLVLLFR